MKDKPLEILIVDDSDDDTQLIVNELMRDGLTCDYRRVEDAKSLRDALDENRNWDLVICDYRMPRFNGKEAFKTVKEMGCDLPFIIISGSIEEDIAVDMIKAGANDYLMKDKIKRLPSAVKRELREAEQRKIRIQAEQEKEMLQDQIRHLQRMEAIGNLAGGVAHDFNNILTIILGYASGMKMGFMSEKEMLESAVVIEDAAKQGAELTKQLLSLARKAKIKEEPVDLHKVIANAVMIVKRTVDKRIAIEQQLKAESFIVSGEAAQLEQIIINLTINAKDVLPEGGTITIRTEDKQLDEGFCKLHPEVKPGNYIHISVSDTGPGIPEETLKKIFDPFFTTKPEGKGTGLGLSIIQGTAANHSGMIDVETEIGVGTTFHIYLPTVIEKVIEEPKLPPPPPDSDVDKVKGGTVLIIDDERYIRLVMSRILKRAGYTVKLATDGADGIKIYKEAINETDIILMDINMPNMGGTECYEKLRTINPGAKVIVATGYGSSGEVQHLIDEGALGYVLKPFMPEELVAAIAEGMAK